MIGTERLYFADSLLVSFEAEIQAHATCDGAPSIVLDRTAFYPESGGQMADHGMLGDAVVVDVQIDAAGVVHHVLQDASALQGLPPGSRVHGQVDFARRRQHMAEHTGQHLLSRALADIAHASTVSSRLGESGCTIDTDRDKLDEALVTQSEAAVLGWIDSDLPVRALFPSPQELALLPLRRAPKVEHNVRVVAVGDIDVSPCGGTHCTHTSQVGLLRIDGVERYKGKARVLFSAGARARQQLVAQSEVVRQLGRVFTCGPDSVLSAVEKLRRELASTRDALEKARMRVASSLAAELVTSMKQRGDHQVIASIDDASMELLRALASRIFESCPAAVAALAATTDDGVLALVARGPESRFDGGALRKRVALAAGGSGGGRAEHAEGRLPAGTAWRELVTEVLGVRC